ncbi:hypothetical protein IV102_26445 [bacterium]|nr:hypothetical protein [bacterium]
MGRERPDMFDVASGECELVDFLLTRFNPLDLKTKINLAPSCVVDEQLAPKKEEEDEPAAVDPVEPQPTAIFVADARDRLVRETAPEASSLDQFQRIPVIAPEATDVLETSEEPAQDDASTPAPATRGPDWLSLIEGFHAAAQRYQTERLEKSADTDEEA